MDRPRSVSSCCEPILVSFLIVKKKFVHEAIYFIMRYETALILFIPRK